MANCDEEARFQELGSSVQPCLNLGYLALKVLPPEWVQRAASLCPRLEELDLSSNALTSLPDALAALTSLRVLRVKYNALSKLPPVLAVLPRLAVLELGGNQLVELEPSVVGQLRTLRALSLSGNMLCTLPEAISQLSLEELDVSNNSLTQLPDSLAACPMLTCLDCSSCRLASLPASLVDSRLQRLFCQSNELRTIPPALGRMKALAQLNATYNPLPLKFQQALERGLARFLAFLREEEEVQRLEEIVRNRPVGIPAGPCTIYACKQTTEQAAASLQGDHVAAAAAASGYAWIRTGHALAQCGRLVLAFGGVPVRGGGAKCADLLCLDTERMEWRVQATHGERPSPRANHCLVADEARHCLFVFGGRKENGRCSAELFMMDVLTWTWHAPKTDGDGPCPREQCSAAFADGKLFIFGGRTHGARMNDLWVLDTSTWSWQQQPARGTAPSPRQGAAACVDDSGQLWVHGGSSNFALDDMFTYCFEAQAGAAACWAEWRRIELEGSLQLARSGGHIAGFQGGALHLFGGVDALGASALGLHKLRRSGTARFEWVETDLALAPNRARIAVLHAGKLLVGQCGHPAHRLLAPSADVERGLVIWDVVQVVELQELQEKETARQAAQPGAAKLARIQHFTQEVAQRLPSAFTTNSLREQQLAAHAAAFGARWAEGHPGRPPPCLALPNEAGCAKVVCTTLRPCTLGHVELFDLEGVAHFLAEFFSYEPLGGRSATLPSHLVSPATLLEWQAGDSLDLATLGASLLLGAGYCAYVVLGYAPRAVALGDQSLSECPWLQQHGVAAPEYVALAVPDEEEEQEDVEARRQMDLEGQQQGEGTAASGGGEEQQAEMRACMEPQQQAEAALQEQQPQGQLISQTEGQGTAAGAPTAAGAVAAVADASPSSAAPCPEEQPPGDAELPAAAAHSARQAAAVGQPQRRLHAWVAVLLPRRGVGQVQLLDPATGQLCSAQEVPCEGIECCWDATNFWCNEQCSADGHPVGPAHLDWNLANPEAWSPLVHMPEEAWDARTAGTESTLASSLFRSHPSKPSALLDPAPSWAHSGPSRQFTPRAGSTLPPPASPSKPQLAAAASQRQASGGRDAMLQTLVATPLGVSACSIKEVDNSPACLVPDESAARSQLSPLLQPQLGGGSRDLPATPAIGVPLSWVPPLVLTRERLDLRCPRGYKCVQYRQCRREMLAPFGECSRWDGLVERLTTYADPECTLPECVLELFARRQDGLERREAHPGERTVVESFGRGAVGALRSVRSVSGLAGRTQELTFYEEDRPDGLMRRLQQPGISMEEWFLPGSRSDSLAYRRVRYAVPEAGRMPSAIPGARPSSSRPPCGAPVLPGGGGLQRQGSALSSAVALQGCPICKVVERYCSSPQQAVGVEQPAGPLASAQGALVKRSFRLQDSRVKVVQHSREGGGTLVSRTYGPEGQLLPSAGQLAPLPAEQAHREWVQLRAAARAAEAAVQAAEEETEELLAARLRQEQNVVLDTPHWDCARVKVEESDEEPEGPEGGYDFLSHFLPRTGARDMTAAEARHAAACCMDAFEERAAARQRIMQAHAAEAAAELAQLSARLAREAQHLLPEEVGLLEEQAAGARFRLGVLHKRLGAHAAGVAGKRHELEARVAADKRIAAALRTL